MDSSGPEASEEMSNSCGKFCWLVPTSRLLLLLVVYRGWVAPVVRCFFFQMLTEFEEIVPASGELVALAAPEIRALGQEANERMKWKIKKFSRNPEVSSILRFFHALFPKISRQCIISCTFLWNSGKFSSKSRRKIAKFIETREWKMKFHFHSVKKLDGFSLCKVWESYRIL